MLAKGILLFVCSSFITFILLMIALLIWASSLSIEQPSDADGIGFGVVYGFLAAVPTSIVIGIIITLTVYAVKWYRES